LSSITLSPVSDRILVADQNLDPNLVAAHLDRKDRSVVRPQVEGATALEVETGVVPMTSQDAVFDGAPLEREAHMRATIVEGEDAPAVANDEDRTVAAMHDEPPLCPQLLEVPGKHEFLVRRVHAHLSAQLCLWGAMGNPRSTTNIGILSHKREGAWSARQERRQNSGSADPIDRLPHDSGAKPP
jgi:hypothetical protein